MSQAKQILDDLSTGVKQYLRDQSDTEMIAKRLDGPIATIDKMAKLDPSKPIDQKLFREFKKALLDLKNFRFNLGKGRLK